MDAADELLVFGVLQEVLFVHKALVQGVKQPFASSSGLDLLAMRPRHRA